MQDLLSGATVPHRTLSQKVCLLFAKGSFAVMQQVSQQLEADLPSGVAVPHETLSVRFIAACSIIYAQGKLWPCNKADFAADLLSGAAAPH